MPRELHSAALCDRQSRNRCCRERRTVAVYSDSRHWGVSKQGALVGACHRPRFIHRLGRRLQPALPVVLCSAHAGIAAGGGVRPPRSLEAGSPTSPGFRPIPESFVSSTCRRARIAHAAGDSKLRLPLALRGWEKDEKSCPGGDIERPRNTRDWRTSTPWHGPVGPHQNVLKFYFTPRLPETREGEVPGQVTPRQHPASAGSFPEAQSRSPGWGRVLSKGGPRLGPTGPAARATHR
jgi:hypothetical protein